MLSAAEVAAEIPPAFICPFTQDIMKDPVTASDGHSYEASAITTWLRSSDLSPLTGQPLPHKQLTRSHALRNAIQEHEQARVARQKRLQAAGAAAPSGSKVILLGDSAVGKSSLVHRVKEGTFSAAASQPTIGCSFCTHAIALPTGRVTLAIWDTAGQEKYRAFVTGATDRIPAGRLAGWLAGELGEAAACCCGCSSDCALAAARADAPILPRGSRRDPIV